MEKEERRVALDEKLAARRAKSKEFSALVFISCALLGSLLVLGTLAFEAAKRMFF